VDIEERDLVGCCGLYCGLCTKFQSRAKSRCLGCKLGEQHSWCSIWNCCVKRHGFETCAECLEAPNCEIFLRRKVVEWVPAMDNLHQIAETGVESWLEEQRERRALVEELLQNYNEGRSMTFYCKACTRMPVVAIDQAIQESKKRIMGENIEESDIRSKAKIVKEIVRELVSASGVDLT
jgi:hypothetical protein